MNIGIDIGGTSIRVGLVENDFIIKKITFLTDKQNFELSMDKIKNIILSWQVNIETIGIGCPGPLNRKTGIFGSIPNLPGWKDKNIISYFKSTFKNIEIKINNDANIAALGQYLNLSNQEKIESLLYFTFSTGIGAGFVYNGCIYNGFSDNALEIANSIPNPNADKPQYSGIEYIGSGNNILKNSERNNIFVNNNKELFKLFNDGDKNVIKYIKNVENQIISFISTCVYVIDPQVIVFGGSVALKQKKWFESIIDKVKLIITDIDNKSSFKFATNIDDSTLLGACKQ